MILSSVQFVSNAVLYLHCLFIWVFSFLPLACSDCRVTVDPPLLIPRQYNMIMVLSFSPFQLK